MKILKQIFKYFFRTFFFLLLGLMIYSIISTALFKQKYVNVFGYTFFVVASGSMTGTIDINDMVIVKITDDIHVDDIVTYLQDGYYITHRVISTNDDEIITKGDVNSTEDSPILKKDIIGKVVFVFPFSIIFEIVGSILLLVIIIFVFNFEKIFKKYVLDDENFQLKISSSDSKKDVVTTDKIKKIQDQEYSLFVKSLLQLIKKRKNNQLAVMNEYWNARLRFIIKSSEYIELKKYDLLITLVQNYPIKYYENVHKMLDERILIELRKESFQSYYVLLLNCILYGDYELYDFILYYFKEKVVSFCQNRMLD